MKATILLIASFLATGAIAQTNKAAPQVLSSGNGRFVYGQIAEYTSQQFMLDTQTGRLWQISKYTPTKSDGTPDKENTVDVLYPVPYYEGNGKFGSLPYSLPPAK